VREVWYSRISFAALEVAVDEQAADVDAKARQQADGVHLGEDRLRALVSRMMLV